MSCVNICCETYDTIGFSDASSGRSIKNNASSAVLLWRFGEHKVLFPGDCTVHTMYYMNENNLLGETKNSILLAPHHGSVTSSAANIDEGDEWYVLEKFLQNIEPSAIIISAGLNNAHGHPNASFIAKSEAVLTTTRCKWHSIYYNPTLSGKIKSGYNYLWEDCKLYTSARVNLAEEIAYAHYYTGIDDFTTINTCYVTGTPEAPEEASTDSNETLDIEAKLQNETTGTNHNSAGIRLCTVDMDQIDFLDYRTGRR
jgi:hypothetical protein